MSINTEGAVMGAMGVIDEDRALDARQGREREMTDPENKIRPSVHRDTFAHSPDHPLFEVKTDCFHGCGFDSHLIKLV